MSSLYEELIQTNVDIAITEEELTMSIGIEKIIDSLDEALDEVEVKIKNETTIPKGGSEHKRRRRTLKSIEINVRMISYHENRNMKKRMNYLMEEIVFLKQIQTLPSCA